MNVPAGLKYAKTDEWVKLDGDIATIGVTDFAQNQLSDVVFVEINVSDGDQVKAGKVFGTIESVKAASDVNLPVSGVVVEVNDKLADSPEKVNSDPFGEAWMVIIRISSPAELDGLMDAAAYQTFCETRGH